MIPVFPNKSYKFSNSKQLFFLKKRHNYDETTLWQVYNVAFN